MTIYNAVASAGSGKPKLIFKHIFTPASNTDSTNIGVQVPVNGALSNIDGKSFAVVFTAKLQVAYDNSVQGYAFFYTSGGQLIDDIALGIPSGTTNPSDVTVLTALADDLYIMDYRRFANSSDLVRIFSKMSRLFSQTAYIKLARSASDSSWPLWIHNSGETSISIYEL